MAWLWKAGGRKLTRLKMLPGVPVDYLLEQLGKAAGNEVASGKFASPQSSSSLAANCFAWFHNRPSLLPAFPYVAAGYPALSVDTEREVRFPWRGGEHPWLDAFITTETHII